MSKLFTNEENYPVNTLCFFLVVYLLRHMHTHTQIYIVQWVKCCHLNYEFWAYTLFVSGFVHRLYRKQHHGSIYSTRNLKIVCSAVGIHEESANTYISASCVSIWREVHIHIFENQISNPHHSIRGGYLRSWLYIFIAPPTGINCKNGDLHQVPGGDWAPMNREDGC